MNDGSFHGSAMFSSRRVTLKLSSLAWMPDTLWSCRRHHGHCSMCLSIKCNVICMKGMRHQHTTTQMSLDSPTPNEKSQSQKVTESVMPLYTMSKRGKSIQTEGRLMVVVGVGALLGNGESLSNGYGVYFGIVKMFWN